MPNWDRSNEVVCEPTQGEAAEATLREVVLTVGRLHALRIFTPEIQRRLAHVVG